MPWTSRNLLEHRQSDKDMRQLSALVDAGDGPVVVHQTLRTADFQVVLASIVLVDHDLIVGRRIAARKVPEAAAHPLEDREINASDRIEPADALDYRARRKHYVRLVHQQWNVLLAQRRRAERRDHRGPRRTHHYVRTHTTRAFLRTVQRAMADAHQRQNH